MTPSPRRSPLPSPGPERFELLSALADGEVDPEGLRQGCAGWRDDAGMRSTWHAYQLIGDVLRSDELASAPGRDAAFVAALRTRLVNEPVVLAPGAVAVRAWRWRATAAVAAGVVAVVGVSVVMRDLGGPGTDDRVSTLAAASPPGGSVLPVSASSPGTAAPSLVVDGNMLRDARLDAYFDAHRGAFGAMPSAVPGGALRNVDVIMQPPR